ncbi:MAG: LysR family transcriptional regulator [Rhodobacteraceae bacterium]|nr:LysR family transcriptional regulator [Paracoccaceae bacterium]
MQDWDVFRYLLAIHRHGGLSGAARVLGVSHATVSRQLDRAEAQLGAKLFDRMPGGLSATDAGDSAVARAEAIEAELIGLDLALTPEEEGPLAITMPPLLATTHLAADLRDFATANPRISLSVLTDNRVFDLHRREADLAIRVTRAPTESLWGRKLTDQRVGYFASPDLIDAHAAALAGSGDPIPFISFTAWKGPLLAEIPEALPGAFVNVTCDDMSAAMGLAATGMGVVRSALCIGSVAPGLRLIETLPLGSYAPIWMLTHPDLRRALKIRRAMRFLADRYAQASALYLGESGVDEKGGPIRPP